jgi:hypothetical protein
VTGKKSRFLIAIGMAAFLTVVGFAGSAGAVAQPQDAASDTAGNVELAARMLDTSDLPADFQPYKPMTGPLDAGRAERLGGALAAEAAGLLHGWVRWWVSRRTGQQVIEMVLDAGTRGGASEASASYESSVLAQGAARQHIAAHLDGYTYPVPVGSTTYTAVGAPLARGPFLFVLLVVAPAQSPSQNVGLLANLLAAQERRVPADTPDTETSLSGLQADPYNAAGAAVGVLVGYLAIVSGIAYLRNPLRGKRRRGQPVVREHWGNQHVVDVSGQAHRHQNIARLRLLLQLTGIALIACGADPYLIPNWYLFVLAGAAVTWAGGRFIHPAGLKVARKRRILSGSRRLRVAVLMSMGSVLVVASVPLLITYGLNQSEPSVVQTANATAVGLPGPGVYTAFVWIGIALLGAGAVISRRARRLAAVDATHLIQRDTRAPVLYLRSFGDDALKLWTATFGRPSLVERFTPRRFDAFEEVIARHFSVTGPVIALNPPGTKLAPLGAARETLDSAAWEATIAGWMRRSAVIVFVAPPGLVTPGLTWELQHVSANQYWDKTLILVPPVPAGLLRARWQAFLAAFAGLWPFTLPLATAVPGPLALTFRNAAWTAIGADRQNEWAYSAAIHEALGASRRPAATGAPA